MIGWMAYDVFVGVGVNCIWGCCVLFCVIGFGLLCRSGRFVVFICFVDCLG